MKIILKGCTQDVIDEICEKIGSRIILDCEECGVYEDDEAIYDIELDSTRCALYTFSEFISITRIDDDHLYAMTIADFRFEEVIIK